MTSHPEQGEWSWDLSSWTDTGCNGSSASSYQLLEHGEPTDVLALALDHLHARLRAELIFLVRPDAF